MKKEHIKSVSFFENKDWTVNQSGLCHKETNTQVTWEEIKTFHGLEVRTIHSFSVQPWPFWEFTKKEKWFNYETYKEAFCFALGFLTMVRHNAKALKHYAALHPKS